MKLLNSTSDVIYYKNSGPLTQPFLEKDFVYEKVLIDLNHKQKDINSTYFLESLSLWIKHEVAYSNEYEIQNKKFSRTAKEIWDSKKGSGCTDYALLFATFARSLDIPTTILHTAQLEWLKRYKNKSDYFVHYGHTFCECFFNNKWILVDPSSCKIIDNYDQTKIILPYNIAGNNIYISYYRGLDFGQKSTVGEHNKIMEEKCDKLDLDLT